MKNFFTLKRTICVVWTLLVLVPLAMGSGYKDGRTTTITLVHTNDVHSNVAIEPYIKGFVDGLRAEKRPVVLVSAGDAFDGTPFATLSKGMDVATVMNMTGYEVFTLGNHEQFPVVGFQNIAPKLEFPLLGANISEYWKKEIPSIQDYVIKQVGGINIAFMGITTGTTGDESVAALERARQTAASADIYIGITHLGVQDPDETIRSTYLAEHCPWLTAIIDGHCHTALQEGMWYNGVLIAETGEFGANIGVVEIKLEGKKVTGVSARLIPIKGQEAKSGIIPDAEVQAFIDQVNQRNAVYLDEIVFTLPIPLQGTRNPNRRVESYFGDLLMDALRWKTGAELAVFPGPGFRADLPEGPVTRGQLQTALYLDMQVCTVGVQGSAIYEMLEKAVSAYPNENNFFVQQSGLLIEFDQTAPGGNRLLKVKLLDGSELDPDRVYTYASKSDSLWVLPGGEEPYLEDQVIADYTLCDLFVEYLNSGVEITGEIDYRTKGVK